MRLPLWSPHLYHTHECPDLFRWQGRWALVFSEFSDRMVTHYRMSDALDGSWLAPPRDTFDGRAFYAAKTVSDGRRRFVLGWNPTREGESDGGKWEWGGNMVIHEMKPAEDGGIAVVAVPEIVRSVAVLRALSFEPKLGAWEASGSTFHAMATDGFAAATLGEMPDPCRISLDITAGPGTRACGLLIKATGDLEGYHQVRWEPGRQRIIYDRWPRPGDEPFMLEQAVAGGEALRLTLLSEGSTCVVYAGDDAALSYRIYEPGGRLCGLFVVEGEATFSAVEIAAMR